MLTSCSTTACDVTGLVRSAGQLSNISISSLFEHKNVILTHKNVGFHTNLDKYSINITSSQSFDHCIPNIVFIVQGAT